MWGQRLNLGVSRQAHEASTRRYCQVAASKCWLVGSGPGALELMTVKSLELLEQADCVIYDDLASQQGLSRCKPEADLVYVGKRGGTPSPKQPEICQLLVKKCGEYDQVVRLKGGCVTIFSRVSEEIEALTTYGIDYELVPGVSSAFAAPALAGFPLTDKNLGRTFAAVLAGAMQAGWSADTSVALVKAAGRPEQEIWKSNLGKLHDVVVDQDLSPAVLVIGNVSNI